MKFWIVDAFTDQPFSGNPAGVCILDGQKHNMSDSLMQSIAMELGLSEVAFVIPVREGKYIANSPCVNRMSKESKCSKTYMSDERHSINVNGKCYSIRWFTPNSEAPLCGHATIAALHILIEEKLEKCDQNVIFQSLAGDISCNKSSINQFITLDFPSYPLQSIEYPIHFHNIIQTAPIEVGISENCIIMEFSDPLDVLNLKPNLQLLELEPYRALIATAVADSMFNGYDFVLRYFAPKVGIDEDPVCGSAHSRLTPYWSKKLQKNNLISYSLSKRGGVVHSRVVDDRVMISGKAVTVFEGVIRNI